jgi:hypothetical protein
MYTSRSAPRRGPRSRRLRRQPEVGRRAAGRLPERQRVSRPARDRPSGRHLAERRRLRRLGRRRDRRPRQPGWPSPPRRRAQIDSGLSTLSAPAALRDSEPGQIREEAALRIPRRCRGFSNRDELILRSHPPGARDAASPRRAARRPRPAAAADPRRNRAPPQRAASGLSRRAWDALRRGGVRSGEGTPGEGELDHRTGDAIDRPFQSFVSVCDARDGAVHVRDGGGDRSSPTRHVGPRLIVRGNAVDVAAGYPIDPESGLAEPLT